MTPWTVLKDFARTNPPAFAILAAAVAAFATVAAIGTFGIDLESSKPTLLYVLAVGVGLTVAARALNDAVLGTVLVWFATILFVLWVGVFGLNKWNPRDERLACLAFFWTSCRLAADQSAIATAPATVGTSGQVGAPASPPVASNAQVFVQFAGFPRDTVRVAMRGLKAAGWQVEDVEGGGERLGSAAGLRQVRYGDPSDRDAAFALARAIERTDLGTGAMSTLSLPMIGKGKLEVWISP